MIRGQTLRLALLMLVFVATVAVTVRRTIQETPSVESRLEALEKQLAVQASQLKAQEQALADFERISKALLQSCKQLQNSVKESRDEGFTWAGPNPNSKEALLRGLSDFSKTVERAIQPADNKKEKDSE